jgi:hypothetical protein
VGGACSTYGGEKCFIRFFGGETCRKETIWKTQDNIKLNLQEVEWGGMNRIDLAQDEDR